MSNDAGAAKEGREVAKRQTPAVKVARSRFIIGIVTMVNLYFRKNVFDLLVLPEGGCN